MEQINHSHVDVRGLNLHVADIGQGHGFRTSSSSLLNTGPKVVLFLHGFPEIWYTWRHQMMAVAGAGYRAIAIDFRGYGLSDQPLEPEKGTFTDLVEDVVALLDALAINKVFVVGKDFGALVAYLVATFHPERVHRLISLGIPFMLPGPSILPSDLLSEGFYVLRWQELGRAEADFGRLDVKTVIRNIYILFSGSELPTAADNQEIMDLVDASTPLPPWLCEEDLTAYASLYEKSGFLYALQVPYRTMTKDLGITNPKVEAPAFLIMGEKDYVLKIPGMEDYIKSGMVKHFVPNLDVSYVPEGSHFVHEQLPERVNYLIISFLNRHEF